MNAQIEYYVEQMEAALMMELVEGKNQTNLFKIASDMIDEDQTQYMNVCQAYEVVKHELLG